MNDDDGRLYRIFTRTWWRYNSAYPDKREPCPGRRNYRGHPQRLTYDEAREYCRQWNATHDPGPLSRKAEFEER